MNRPFVSFGGTVDTIVSGGHLLAAAQDLDPATLEQIIRKCANIASFAALQDMRNSFANDDTLAQS